MVVWKNEAAPVLPVNVAGWAEMDRLNATLNSTRNKLTIKIIEGWRSLFIQSSKYNMRTVYAYVLDSSFAV